MSGGGSERHVSSSFTSSLITRDTLLTASISAVMATTSGYPSGIRGTSVFSNISKLRGEEEGREGGRREEGGRKER